MFGWGRAAAQQKKNGTTVETVTDRSLIDIHNVIKIFDTAAGQFKALRGVDLQVTHGEFVAVVGKSGSGKSTLSNMMTGIDRPTEGDVYKLNENQIASWRGRNVGVVFQFFQLLPTLTVLENIMLPMDFCNMYDPGDRRERALILLEKVDMAGEADKLPTAISGGQQQRVAIARALANDPPIIIADEPTGNLDSRTADAVFTLFEQLVDGGKTILMVTHDDDLARRVSRTVTIADGMIVGDQKRSRGGSGGRVESEEGAIAATTVAATPPLLPVEPTHA